VAAAVTASGFRSVQRAGGPAVEALATIFHAHPAGQTTLVRFTASGIDAPAGRLRVVDPAGRLLGTAGMLRRGDLLVGELWLPLVRPITVRSRLETPVTRGPIQTTHRLLPTPRLTLSWLTLAQPGALEARARSVPLLARGADAAALFAAGVRANPWSPPGDAERRDHLDLLRVAVPAARARLATGVPVSRIAVVDAARFEPFVEAALAESGIALVLASAQLATPETFGLGEGRLVMARRIEQWLTGATPQDRPAALVVGPDLASAERAFGTVEDWNATYAFPHIIVGDGDAALAVARPLAARGTSLPAGDAPGPPRYRPPAEVFAPLARAISPGDPTLAGIAAAVAFPVRGAIVFNPSPFGQSGPVTMPDGSTRIATDVPGVGFAFLPDAAGASAGAAGTQAAWTGSTIETSQHALRIDRGDGSIISLVSRATGRDLVRAGGRLNGLEGAVLSGVTVEPLPEVGVRIQARRVTPLETVLSTVTLYDALPWVDVVNEVERWDGQAGRAWEFEFAGEIDEVRWDVAGGSLAAAPPVAVAPLRWLALHAGPGATLLAVRGVLAASIADGRLALQHADTTSASATVAPEPLRLRLASHDGFLLSDDPWRFGFSLESLIAVAAPGAGAGRLPTFGRLFDVADPAVAVVGVKLADDGVGVLLYLMDLAGVARGVPVRPGVLTFDGATLTDLTERDRGPADREPGGGVLVPLPERGYAAARLLGIRLA
jgi:hypothetical protein